MRDLVAINGPWQVVTFLNFYMTEYGEKSPPPCTVIFYEINDELKRVCQLILSSYDYVDQIYDAKDLNNIIERSFNNIWICKLFSFESKKLVDSFPLLPIILFEEGMHSYVHKQYFTLMNVIRSTDTINKKLKVSLKYFFKKEDLIRFFPELILPTHQKKCIRNYYLFSLLASGNPKNKISSQYVFNVLEQANRVLEPESILSSGRPCVLVVGQYFSNLDLLTFEYELNVYFRILNYYIDKGFDVYWKGHPRNKMFDQKIKESFGDNVKILKNNSIPLEIFLISNPDIEVCGLSSSVLLYKALLFNDKTKQCLYLVKNQLNKNCIWYNDFLKIFSLIESNVQRINIHML
ncbi:hypothetical protein SAMN05428642_1021103 [Flaviramulus basaltis]|uniref:Glycosyltransferase family 52 n=1 Tax=Flaviramulus basaltis TaxID=369401 RepID=A0A1K2IKY4_9FLAO|nr:alpha-2,8-polysialyltransferase family protein [Flaviramulus basaltis]SFZ92966.1 hypothetical protein SAMN05428642_1021103 [Flaviramulus basaltis]